MAQDQSLGLVDVPIDSLENTQSEGASLAGSVLCLSDEVGVSDQIVAMEEQKKKRQS